MSRVDQARLLELFAYDAEAGEFIRRKTASNRGVAGTVAGGPTNKGYHAIRVDKVLYETHRLVWLYVTGEWPKNCIDHINGNKSDNRFANLRDVSRAENMQNLVKPGRANKTGYIGVTHSYGRFRASIYAGGRIELGVFDTAEQAAAAYLAAKQIHHPTAPLRAPEFIPARTAA